MSAVSCALDAATQELMALPINKRDIPAIAEAHGLRGLQLQRLAGRVTGEENKRGESRAGPSVFDMLEASENLAREKPLEPLELNDGAALSNTNPSITPRQTSRNPSIGKTVSDSGPGQNEVAELVTTEINGVFAWDDTAGSWFEREHIAAPFCECSPTRLWRAVRDECSRHKEKFAAGFVNGIETFCKADLHVEAWRSDPHELPMKNGVLDLKAQRLRDYTWSDRFNWQLPYVFDIKATCPLIDSVLDRMVGGDNELRAFLDAWLVVLLRGRYDVQAFIELVGEGGTGKSTFLDIAAMLVGEENVASTDLASLEGNQFETAGIYGKRLALVTDSARFRGDVPVLKAITGNDPIRLERKNQQQRRPYVFTGLVAIAANQPLESSDYSTGLSRRRRPIAIDSRVTEAERAPYRDRERYPGGFKGALRAEMPGLMNRLLAINVNEAVQVVANPGVGMARQRLLAELDTNPMLAWAEERLVPCNPGSETQVGDADMGAQRGLFANYTAHCRSRGLHPVSLTRFGRDLVPLLIQNGVDTEKARLKAAIIRRLRLRTPADDGVQTLLLGLNPSMDENVEGFTEGLNGAVVDFEGFEGSKQTSDFRAYSKASGR